MADRPTAVMIEIVTVQRGFGKMKWTLHRWEKSQRYSVTRYTNEGWCWLGSTVGNYPTEIEAREAMKLDIREQGYRA